MTVESLRIERQQWMLPLLSRVKVIDFHDCLHLWQSIEFVPAAFDPNIASFASLLEAAKDTDYKFFEVARIWSWADGIQYKSADDYQYHRAYFKVDTLVAFFWPPPGRTPLAAASSMGNQWARRDVIARRYIINFDLDRPLHFLPGANSLLWNDRDMIKGAQLIVFVFHRKSGAGRSFSREELQPLQATLASLIRLAWEVDARDGRVQIVGADKLPSNVFPLPREAWSTWAWDELHERGGVNLRGLLQAQDLEAIRRCRRHPNNFSLRSPDSVFACDAHEWPLLTRDDYYQVEPDEFNLDMYISDHASTDLSLGPADHSDLDFWGGEDEAGSAGGSSVDGTSELGGDIPPSDGPSDDGP
jgi:hypothetical protein